VLLLEVAFLVVRPEVGHLLGVAWGGGISRKFWNISSEAVDKCTRDM